MSATEFPIKRKFSALLRAKCLTQAATPSPWMPSASAAASLPARYGSSEKYSKLRPAVGLRLIFAPGPKTTCTPYLCASLPMARPTLRAFSSSQPQASAAAVGKAVAGKLPVTPLSPPSPCTLRPCGPSDMRREGMPRRGTGLVYMKSVPATSAAFSSALSPASNLPISI